MDSLLFRHQDSPAQLPPQVGSLCSTQKDLTNITQHRYFPTQTGTLCPQGQCGIMCRTGGSRFPCADQSAGSPAKDHADRQTALQPQSSCAHQVFFLSPEALQMSGVRFLFSHITKKLCTLAAGDTRFIPPESRGSHISLPQQISEDPPPSLRLLSQCPHVVTGHKLLFSSWHIGSRRCLTSRVLY